MSERHVYLFPDTNALLHYPQIKDVDWSAIVGGGSVTIVLCLQVIQELDDKKSDTRLRTRAEKAIREIRDLVSSGGLVREGVNVEVFNETLRSTDFDASLSPDSGDDRIVRLVQKYFEKNGKVDLAVYSEDLGMSLRCAAHGISVIEPDKCSRLEDPHSELEKKYKAAVVENQALKNQLPDIRVVIIGEDSESGGSVAVFKLVRSIGGACDVEAEVESERRRLALPPPLGSSLPNPSMGQGARLSDLVGFNQPLSDDQRRQYEEALNSYLKEFAVWIERDHAARSAVERMIEFKVGIGNEGRAVGEEVDVYLNFPHVFEYLSGEDEQIGTLPEPPNRPKPPRRPQGGTMSSLHAWLGSGGFGSSFDLNTPHDSYHFNMPKIPTPRDPWCKITDNAENGATMRIFVPRLNHHTQQVFGPFHAVLKSWEVAKPFEVRVDILSASHPDKGTSRSVFKIAVVSEDD